MKFRTIMIFPFLLFIVVHIWIGVQVYDEYMILGINQVIENSMLSFQPCTSNKSMMRVTVSERSLSRTVNFGGISYIRNLPTLCTSSESLSLLVTIISAPANVNHRQNLRETWMQALTNRSDSRIVFFLGLSNSIDTNNAIFEEEKVYKDMVIADFDDRYRNLTLKMVVVLQWIHKFCPNAKYVMKCDDDMFINVYNLLHFVKYHTPDGRSFYGRLRTKYRPVRDPHSPYAKWLVTEEEYPESAYPDFLGGASYLFGTAGISDLLDVSLKLPYLYLEDVFITGLTAEIANYCRQHHSLFVKDDSPRKICNVHSAITVLEVSGPRMEFLWKSISTSEKYKYCGLQKLENL